MLEINTTDVILVITTSVITSLMTLGIGYLIFRVYFKKQLLQEIDEVSGTIKERLREGVLEAGIELKPHFRAEVKEGFTEAMGSVMSGDLVEHTARRMAKNSSTIVEQGLGMLLGIKPTEKKDD